MALLQISEPGQSPDPHQRRLTIGIDLGTTHSLVAAMRHGSAECLPDLAGRVLLPSAVRYLPAGEGTGRQIGHEALAAQVTDPANTITSVKRLMGRSRSDIEQVDQLPYVVLDTPQMASVQTVAGVKSPVEVSAEILATLRYRAEDSFDDDVFGAVITVPAYFDDAQRQATKDAAQLAGIEVLRLINEPTAAAIAYGLDEGAEGVFAVFDLGGGTFDISILRLSQGVFEVIATGGDSALGGDDYDRAIANWAWRAAGGDSVEGLPDTDRAVLMQAARYAKESLSASQGSVNLHAGLSQGLVDVVLTTEGFGEISAPLTQRAIKVTKRALRDADLQISDIQGVVMVGGSTRMPVVRSAVRDLFQQEPLINLNPDEVVAIGAARQAHVLAGNSTEEMLLLDVTPLSLGIETMGGLVERIVPRNSTIPTARGQDFTTYKDGQTALALHVVQGERDLVQDCRSLARFELRGIPPMAAGAARIRVTFMVDADGLLKVSATELGTGIEASVDIKPSYGLSDEQIAQMLQDSFATAQEDIQARALVEAKVDGERMVNATLSAIAADGDLLSEESRAQIEAAIGNLQTLLATSTQASDIEAATEQLAKATEPFAAARMNQGIARALSGQKLESL